MSTVEDNQNNDNNNNNSDTNNPTMTMNDDDNDGDSHRPIPIGVLLDPNPEEIHIGTITKTITTTTTTTIEAGAGLADENHINLTSIAADKADAAAAPPTNDAALPQEGTTSTTTTIATTSTETDQIVKVEEIAIVETQEPVSGNDVVKKVILTWEPDTARKIVQQQQQQQQEMVAAAETSSTNHHQQRPYMVAIVGIPGSGKSTSAGILSQIVEEHGVPNFVMPFDGYHYPLQTLKTNQTLFPDADDAIYRRGAPDTFDVQSLQRDLDRIRNGLTESIISIPGFDHGIGDPTPNEHTYERSKHSIVFVEGLYLLLDDDKEIEDTAGDDGKGSNDDHKEETNNNSSRSNGNNRRGWSSIRDYFDYCIFVDADVNKCMERLKERNKVIPGYTEEEILVRVDAVDRVNAMTVMKSKHRADLVVQSAALLPAAPAEVDAVVAPAADDE